MQITDYLPYGKERITQRNTDYKNKYGFIGKEKDNESGLNYVEARYYDSNLGRFVAQDKMFWEVGQTKRGIGVMMDPQQLNSYSYARNNPVILKDPSGESLDLLGDDVGTPVTQAAALYIGAVIAAGKALSDQLDIVVDAVSNVSVSVVPTGPDTTYQQQAKQANQSGAGTTAPAGNPALSQNSSISLSGSPSPGGGNNGKKDEKKGAESKNKGNTGGTSKTITNVEVRGGMARVDIEYPTGGSSGNVHVQFKGKGGNWKEFLNTASDLSKLPKSIRNNKDIIEGVNKAFRNLESATKK